MQMQRLGTARVCACIRVHVKHADSHAPVQYACEVRCARAVVRAIRMAMSDQSRRDL